MKPLALAAALLVLPVLAACESGSPPAPAASTPAAPAASTRPATAAVDPRLAPLFGTWSADLAQCDNPPIRISATRFEGTENVCDIASLAGSGDGSFTASLNCTAEGRQTEETLQLTPVFAPTGEGITLTWPDRGSEKVTVLRCGKR